MRLVKSILSGIILLLFALGSTQSSASQLHVRIGDPVYDYLERMATRGFLPGYMDDTRPLTRDYIAEQLRRLDEQRSELSRIEREILNEYISDYRYELTDERYFQLQPDKHTYHPFSSLNNFTGALTEVFRYTPAQEEHHLAVYEEENDAVWLDWDEMQLYENKSGTGRYLIQHAYRLSVNYGENFSAYSDAHIYDQQVKPGFGEVSKFYRGGFYSGVRATANKSVRYTSYDYSRGYLQYQFNKSTLSLGLENFAWGVSSNPVALSYNVPPIPYLSYQMMLGPTRFTFLHGWLSSYPWENYKLTYTPGSNWVQKYLVTHRWEIPVYSWWQINLTETVVYGGRDPEMAYLVPLSFLWSTQHNVDNNDNVLLFLESTFQPIAGLEFYGSFILDELSTSRIAEDWWGNKWGVQAGSLVSYSVADIPVDTRVEFTAIRPWVYTHKKPERSSFTHHGRSLGFYGGPNSQQITIDNRIWVGRRGRLSLFRNQFKHGSSPLSPNDPSYYPYGGDPNQNYHERNTQFDYSTSWLMGEITTTRELGIRGEFQLTNIIRLLSGYTYQTVNERSDNYFYFQLRFDY
ncbi:MAG: hypothetical protein K9N46_07890 [Candidatus Marinimicrobia bacterium]|nr:hypothetical protein [Candidatus Neomarinimicrobiota bacterium]MCF7828727.1 hypothetical protein [Candidatus Neomarinimicrobiota bacterium]MCF7880644.1 hypothetical protein [Candidatus Neomarinimicrobiota bacterium]